MASSQDLVQMLTDGKLGEFLAERFDGERCQTYSIKDSEFIITFKSEEETPGIDLLLDSISEFFLQKGYRFDLQGTPEDDSLMVNISSTDNEGFVFIVVTTKYPFPAPGQGNASLRVNSNLIF